MISNEQVQSALTNDADMLFIYNTVFYEDGKPKVRMWLINKGVDYKELDDVETEIKLSFIDGLQRYTYGKIDFEKYIWTKFNHTLLNYYVNKKLKKNSSETTFTQVEGDNTPINIGFIPPSNEEKYDFEKIFLKLETIQATICRLLYYNQWNKHQIMNYLELEPEEYDSNIKDIRVVMEEYLTGD